MKNIRIYKADKYKGEDYEEVFPNIYIHQHIFGNSMVPVEEDIQQELENSEAWNINEHKIFDTIIYNGVKYYRFKNNEQNGVILQYDGNPQTVYVCSLVFEQEPEYEENGNEERVSQYPLEDILEKFEIFALDLYDELNKQDRENSYIELASNDIESLKNALSIVGKHVYNKIEGEYVKLIIE